MIHVCKNLSQIIQSWDVRCRLSQAGCQYEGHVLTALFNIPKHLLTAMHYGGRTPSIQTLQCNELVKNRFKKNLIKVGEKKRSMYITPMLSPVAQLG